MVEIITVVAVPSSIKIDDKLYLSDAVDYVSPGKVFVYAEDGNFITENTRLSFKWFLQIGRLDSAHEDFLNATALLYLIFCVTRLIGYFNF